jgi:hypothetical protein
MLFWYAFGPLQLRHADLWEITLGELLDLIDGYRYRDYLETRRLTAAAALVANCSGNLKRPLRVDDLVGHWVNGRLMDTQEYWEYSKALAIKRKHDRLRREGVE